MHCFLAKFPAKWRLPFSVCLLASLPATAQVVDSVRVSFDQSRLLMRINYDLYDLNYRKEINIVPVYVVGDTLTGALHHATGDLGWTSRRGRNKQILWDPFKDGLSSLDGVRITIETELRDANIPRFWALEWQGSNSAPFGLKVMQLNWLGFFGGFRLGNRAPAYRYTVADNGDIDYQDSGTYERTDKRRLASYAVTAGPLFQITRTLYTYAGVGYGLEQLFWKYQAYTPDNTPSTTFWALHKSRDHKGVMADAGFLIRLGPVVVDAGVSTIQFKSLQVTLGVGYTLYKVKTGAKNRQKPH